MSLFKNNVGRPSNEIKKKRKIFYSLVSAIIIIFVCLIIANVDKIFNLKGAVTSASGAIKAEKAYYYSQLDYDELYCGRTSGGEATSKCKRGNTICTSGCGGTSIAIALSTLTQNKNFNPSNISKRAAQLENANNGEKKGAYCGTSKDGVHAIGTNSVGIKAIIKSYGIFSVKRMTVEPGDIYSEEYPKAYIINQLKSTLKNGGQVVINAPSKGCFTSFGHYMAITSISKDEKSVYLLDPNDGHKTQTKYEPGVCNHKRNKRNGWWNINDLLNPGGITASGHFTVFLITKKPFTFSCDSSSSIGKNFECKTNQSDVTITLSGSNSLAKGISPEFITTASEQIKKIMYTSDLFKNYKSEIKKDSNGNKYINATITASKFGYNKITQKVKIYKKDIKTTTQKTLTLSCPSSARLNTEFICNTNMAGVEISVGGANSLATGYKPSFKTTLFDKNKSIKYTSKLFTNYKSIIKRDQKGEYIIAKITAKKSGYKTVTKNVKIYRNVSNTTNVKMGLILSCPETAKVDEKIICKTNMSGVVLRTSYPQNLASGYTEKFTTTNNDMTKSLKYTKAGTYHVKASKTGYKDVIKIIKVN